MPKPKRIAVMIDLQWPVRHHRDIYQGIQHFAKEHADWECVLDPFADRLLTPGSSAAGYDGIIARATARLVTRARRKSVSVVNVWRNSPATQVASVFPDFAAAGRSAAEHLLSRGFQHFAYLGFKRDLADVEMRTAFATAIQENEFKCQELLVTYSHSRDEHTWQALEQRLYSFARSWPTPVAIFTSSDLLARFLIEVLRGVGLQVPNDVAIICSETWSVLCLDPAPTLTSIDLGYEQVGIEAAALLHELMLGAKTPEPPRRIALTGLFPRQSTDSFAVDDPLVARSLRFVAENCQRQLTPSEVAVHVKTTLRTLERRFERHLGRTIFAEITRFRVERAKRLLRDGDLLMKQVAKACGFRDAKHMRECFRRTLGVSPSEYRSNGNPTA